MHHFRFDSEFPGIVFVKNSSSDVEQQIQLFKDVSWSPSPDELPQRIVPLGLSIERQWYLYDKIRDFCSDEAKDIVCPKPSHNLYIIYVFNVIFTLLQLYNCSLMGAK